jgi:hypothetical protein
MAGTLTIATLSDGSNSTSSTNCIQGSAKAWVNFNGTTVSPSTIRASYNVGSVTKNGTGDYTLNFTNAMSDANYAAVVTTSAYTSGSVYGKFANIVGTFSGNTAPTTTTLRVTSAYTSGLSDETYYCAAIFR